MFIAELKRLFSHHPVRFLLAGMILLCLFCAPLSFAYFNKTGSAYGYAYQQYYLENYNAELARKEKQLSAQENSVLFQEKGDQAKIYAELQTVRRLQTESLVMADDNAFHAVMSVQKYLAMAVFFAGLMLIHFLFLLLQAFRHSIHILNKLYVASLVHDNLDM